MVDDTLEQELRQLELQKLEFERQKINILNEIQYFSNSNGVDLIDLEDALLELELQKTDLERKKIDIDSQILELNFLNKNVENLIVLEQDLQFTIQEIAQIEEILDQ
ncbi:MAG: hypothetical protein AAFX95_25040 [Cyanobacteria bacterium J06639_16]